MTAAAVPRSARVTARVRSGAGEPVLSVPVARGLAFTALAAWGALHWMALMQPAQPGRGWLVVGVGLAAVFAMLAAGRLPGRWRPLGALAAVPPLLALALLAGGVDDALLRPARWDELTGGIARGISDLPGVRVPYQGVDPWVRLVIPLGGSVLVLLAALLAFWPRRRTLGRPLSAHIVLVTLYVVPIVALDLRGEFLRGAVLALLMVAFLRLEKLRARDAVGAATLALVATLLALVAAPTLNRDTPWWDYETWALETSASKSTAFSWDHSYGPLNWPRDGRELLRVKARQVAYWKAENLDDFDGSRWRRVDPGVEAPGELPSNRTALRQWTQTIRVAVRNLRSETFITAGYASGVNLRGVSGIQTLDGAYDAERTLRRGDTYTAQVYAPRPIETQRRAAGTDYPSDLRIYRTFNVALPGGSATNVTVPAFGVPLDLMESGAPTAGGADVVRRLEDGPLGDVWALSQRLKRGAKTPEDYVQRVLAFLGDGYSYTETPPPAARTLPGFLFQAKTGYCQMFSGAMALLMRMAGIPARVATGFTSGAFDSKTGEYVVRDLDAHSWVEVYYPNYGWVTFDPTPAAAPPRSQPNENATVPNSAVARPPNLGGDLPSSRSDANTDAPGRPLWAMVLILAAPLALLALAATLVQRRRAGARPALSELERALRRTRREPAPGTTLQSLELRFAATPAAAGYVRALREARYRGRPGTPTRAQRRGLRAELARGGGLGGRLRAWWALPPR